MNSPFTLNVLPNFTAPTNIIRDLNRPFRVTVREREERVVSERSGHCVSIISANGEKKSFGTYGSAPGQCEFPEGVAIDGEGNILVCDYGNHRIQQFSPTGEHLKNSRYQGQWTSAFHLPRGIAVHPHTYKVYVTDTGNDRIQVLNSDFTYSSSFGSKGSNNGEFSQLTTYLLTVLAMYMLLIVTTTDPGLL